MIFRRGAAIAGMQMVVTVLRHRPHSTAKRESGPPLIKGQTQAPDQDTARGLSLSSIPEFPPPFVPRNPQLLALPLLPPLDAFAAPIAHTRHPLSSLASPRTMRNGHHRNVAASAGERQDDPTATPSISTGLAARTGFKPPPTKEVADM